MSAIFGARALSEQPLSDALGAGMQAALGFRYADGEGYEQSARTLLGARSFHTTEQACQAAPVVVDEASRTRCVLDGRLDYREQLLAKLGWSSSEQACDEQLIIAAYQKFGGAFAEHLEGDFALALWDARADRLVLARDALGVRSLYFAHTQHALLFASAPRALFACAELSRRINPFRIAAYLAGAFPDASQTFFAEVDRLPPGHVLTVEASQVFVRRYVSLDGVGTLKLGSSAAYAEAFRATFLAAVRERLRTPLDVGCMLSGGLDSGGVLGAMRAQRPGRDVPCFSARFPDFPDIDEGSFLALHSAQGGVARHELRADRLGPLDELDRLHDAIGEPFHAPNFFIYDALTKLARAQGVRVMLDGLDGDTVVEHGLFYLNELLHRGRLRRFARELKALHRRVGFSYPFLLREWALQPDVARLRALRGVVAPGGGLGFLDRRFARACGFVDYLRGEARTRLSASNDFQALHARAVNAPILPFYLEAHDRLAAAHGVDHRHPFFDARLVKFCLSLPAEQRLSDGWDRVIERRAFVGLCPEPILARQSKSVWTANFQRQLLSHNQRRLQDAVALRPHPLEGIVDLKSLRRQLDTLRPGASPELVIRVWNVVTLTRWLTHTGYTV